MTDQPPQDPTQPSPPPPSPDSPEPFRARPAPASVTQDERTYAMWLHLAGLIATVCSAGFAPIIVAFAMWLARKDDSPFIDQHGKEATNFYLSILIYAVIAVPLTFLTCGVGLILFLAIYILAIVGGATAAAAANKNDYAHYPLTIRFIT